MKRIILLLKFAWNKDRKLFSITFIHSLFNAILPVLDIFGIGIIIDELMNMSSTKRIVSILLYYVTINLFCGLLIQKLSYTVDILQRRSTDRLQTEYAWDSLIIDYHYAQDGEMLNQKKNSMSVQPSFYLKHFGTLFTNIVVFFEVLLVFTYVRWYFVLVILMLSAVPIILNFKLKRNEILTGNKMNDIYRRIDYIFDVMTDYVYAKEVRLGNASLFLKDKYNNVLSDAKKEKNNIEKKTLLFHLAYDIFSVLQKGAVYIILVYLVIKNDMTIAQYSIVISSMALLIANVYSFFDKVAILKKMASLYDYVVKYSEFTDAHSLKNRVSDENNIVIDLKKDKICFNHVSFKYPEHDEWVLKDICLEITPNEKIGLIGLNGAGKTTLVKLLTRLYEPTEGFITVGKYKLQDIPIDMWCQKISTVLQDHFLFAYSIEENICFDSDCDKDRLWDVLGRSGVSEKIENLPEKEKTYLYKNISDDGIELSGGEIQKLAIARSIYKDSELIILDEPTSALDAIAERELFDDLDKITMNRTSIFISHRLKSLKRCDYIVVLKDGQILETGNHKDLLNKNGFYADLYRTQSGLYEV